MILRILFAITLSTIATISWAQNSLSKYTENVLIHVLTHEMGHALIREFDLPLLGNEEVIADEFATIFIQQNLPDQAGEIIAARVNAYFSERDDETIFAEHPDDIRRAGRALCLLYGLDPSRHENLAKSYGMTDREARGCRNSAPEIARGWRRVLRPVIMPSTARVTEVRISIGDGPWKVAVENAAFVDTMRSFLAIIDWHSQVTLHIDHCDGGASWSRKRKTIRLCDTYIARFEQQNKEN